MEPDEARTALEAWRASFPDDLYATDAPLRRLNRRALDPGRLADLEEAASELGRRVVTEIGPAAQRYEHRSHLPEVALYDGFGREIAEVCFDPEYHRAGRVVWESGVVALSGTPGRAYEQATLLYLLSHEGEAGHACPATCTIGLARALRRKADAAIRERFLPPLLDPEYDRAERGSQFLTEVQGGSDVGANKAVAVPQGDGTWRVSGEKWFCSVADAGQFLVTARVDGGPPGTKGLGCFAVPRMLDGHLNGFRLRRLKEKIGTRGLATGEIDFDGAVAWPIGPVEEGFKIAVGIVLNTSRWLTAVGDAALMRRAYLEASGFARARSAFGLPIADYPLVRHTLARMKAQWLGALHATWLLTGLEDGIDAGTASDDDVALHRFLVNADKLHTSLEATAVVRDGIEILGGNGTVEDFSVLPRLYRDAIVYESWEGTHNVLAVQVLADLPRLPLMAALERRVTRALDAAPAGSEHAADGTRAALAAALDGVTRSLADPQHAATHFRTYITRLVIVTQAATMLESAEGGGEAAEEIAAAADLLVRLRLDPSYRPEDDDEFLDRLDAVLANDLGPG